MWMEAIPDRRNSRCTGPGLGQYRAAHFFHDRAMNNQVEHIVSSIASRLYNSLDVSYSRNRVQYPRMDVRRRSVTPAVNWLPWTRVNPAFVIRLVKMLIPYFRFISHLILLC